MIKSTCRKERAGRLIAKLRNSDSFDHEELARTAWPLAVGKKIAARTAVAGLVRGRLIVAAEDGVLQEQLYSMRGHILKNLRDIFGADIVVDLEFRPMIPKFAPQRALQPSSVSPTISDDADAIADPLLRRNYKASRGRASRDQASRGKASA